MSGKTKVVTEDVHYRDEEPMKKIFDTIEPQFKKINPKLKPSETPMFFFFEPKYRFGTLRFLFDRTKAIKLQIRDFLLQTNVDGSHIKDLKCHFEYYHYTKQWVVMDLNTSIEDFGNNYHNYESHIIRLRYHI